MILLLENWYFFWQNWPLFLLENWYLLWQNNYSKNREIEKKY